MKEKNNNGKGWGIKYYKGLGTSTTKEAKEYFEELRVVNYKWDDDITSNDSIDLAFNKKEVMTEKLGYKIMIMAKFWIHSLEVSYSEFIHKELIHFSNDDLRRSIPSICDGLKPSQVRKILYCGFKRNLKRSKSSSIFRLCQRAFSLSSW